MLQGLIAVVKRCARWLLPVYAAGLAAGAQADHQPRWELGAGLFVAQLPDYIGADQTQTYVFPYPFVVYRGDRLRVDGDGVRGLLLDHPQLKLDLSANASVALRSDDNRARAGMPDLDYTFELGPSLQWQFERKPEHKGWWRLDLPLRAVFSTDFGSVEHQGWVFSPNVSYRWRWPADAEQPVRWRASAGPVFGSARYHDYIYGVDPEFATPGRAAFRGEAGYSGARMIVSMGRDLNEDVLLGAFLRYDNISGAAFADSPLLRRDDSLMFGVALTWVWARSQERVAHELGDEDDLPSSIR